MEFTRRYWGTVALALSLAGVGGAIERTSLVVAGSGLGAWLLVHQVQFLRTAIRMLTRLEVEQSLQPSRTGADQPVSVTVRASHSKPSPVALSVESDPPAAVSGPPANERRVHLSAGEESRHRSFEVSARVAGSHQFPAPTVAASDPLGLFTVRTAMGETPTLQAESRRPGDVHVGAAGRRIGMAYGSHRSGRTGSGLVPAGVREYSPDDPVSRIDWKVTARLDTPHVREFEVESDRPTVLFVDARESMGRGPDGRTPFDHVRHVAFSFVDGAATHADPLGFCAVGDRSVRSETLPSATPDHYASIRDELHELEPRRERAGRHRIGDSGGHRRAVGRLGGDYSQFASVIRAFAENAEGQKPARRSPSRRRTAGSGSLSDALRTYLPSVGQSPLTVVFTDDTDRSEVSQAVRLARTWSSHVLVFLAPGVLYDAGDLSDIDDAYSQYVAFDEFRRSLTRLPDVSAYEVAPGDSIDEILPSQRSRERRGVRT